MPGRLTNRPWNALGLAAAVLATGRALPAHAAHAAHAAEARPGGAARIAAQGARGTKPAPPGAVRRARRGIPDARAGVVLMLACPVGEYRTPIGRSTLDAPRAECTLSPASVPLFLRRSLVAVLGVFVLQLTLPASAWALGGSCGTGHAAMRAAAPARVLGRPGVSRRANAAGIAVPPAPTAFARREAPFRARPGGQPCRPSLAGGCDGATCAPVAPSAQRGGANPISSHVVSNWPAATTVPPSPGVAPDVPPPRG